MVCTARCVDLAQQLDAVLEQLWRSGLPVASVPLPRALPDLDDEQIEAIAKLLVKHAIDGVTATNTTISREAVAGQKHADETGGLSGAPVFEPSNRVIRKLAHHLDGALPIIGVGGIMSGADAKAKMAAGASLVQFYTGLIYRGPGLVAEVAKALRRA